MEAKRYNTFYTPVGLLNVAHLGHGSVHIEWEGMHIYVDPYNDAYDFTGMKKADLILLTHAHTDHYDCEAIKKIATPNTKFVVSKGVGTCLDNDLLRMRIDVDNNPLNVDPSTNLENMKKSIAFLQLCSAGVESNAGIFAFLGGHRAHFLAESGKHPVASQQPDPHLFDLIRGCGNGETLFRLCHCGIDFFDNCVHNCTISVILVRSPVQKKRQLEEGEKTTSFQAVNFTGSNSLRPG